MRRPELARKLSLCSALALFPLVQSEETRKRTLADETQFASVLEGGGYEAVVSMALPYAGIDIPMKFTVDCTKQKEQVDYYQGLQTDYYNANGKYKYVFQNNKRACLHNEAPHDDDRIPNKEAKEVMEKLGNKDDGSLIHPFPVDLKSYTHEGPAVYQGIKCEKYTSSATHGTTHSMDDALVFYYDNLLHKPIAWHQHSRNKVFDSHTDEYHVRYLDFKKIDGDVPMGDMPEECNKANVQTMTKGKKLSFPLHAVFGQAHHGKAAQLARDQAKDGLLSSHFVAFAQKHGLTYSTAEEWSRRERIFLANVEKIERMNKEHRHENGSQSARFKVNKFAAMTPDEVLSYRGGYRPSPAKLAKLVKAGEEPNSLALDTKFMDKADFDWRTHMPGSVSPIKDQGICGSCWAFSLISAIESVNFIKMGKAVNLPEQFVIDCTWDTDLAACDGGESNLGAEQIIARFGGRVPTTESYGQYLTVDGYCRGHDSDLIVGSLVQQWVSVPSRDQSAVMRALLEQPLSIALNAEPFLYYDAGIVDTAECEATAPSDLNHAINLVGFGTCKETGKKYWTLRNSWSTYWGHEGYFRVVRGKRDCGVSTDAGYPLLNAVGPETKMNANEVRTEVFV
ncbi:unnamed protein product [Amoebophrya sp. A25]|nr:unnamed protein product [Amoebophrya sp. A25]|eukprot:GSA25T00007171001.1